MGLSLCRRLGILLLCPALRRAKGLCSASAAECVPRIKAVSALGAESRSRIVVIDHYIQFIGRLCIGSLICIFIFTPRTVKFVHSDAPFAVSLLSNQITLIVYTIPCSVSNEYVPLFSARGIFLLSAVTVIFLSVLITAG